MEKEKSSLFGKQFEDKLLKTIESKEKSEDLLKVFSKKSTMPFRKGPCIQNREYQGQSQQQHFSRGADRNGRHRGNTYKRSFNTINRGKYNSIAYLLSPSKSPARGGVSKHSAISKRVVYHKNSKCSISRQTKTLRPVINFIVEFTRTLSTFVVLQKGDCVQTGSERCLFFSSASSKVPEKICVFFGRGHCMSSCAYVLDWRQPHICSRSY